MSEEVWSQFDFTKHENHLVPSYLANIVNSSLPGGFTSAFWDRLITRLRTNFRDSWPLMVANYQNASYQFIPTREYLALLISTNTRQTIITIPEPGTAKAFIHSTLPRVVGVSYSGFGITREVTEYSLHYWDFSDARSFSTLDSIERAFDVPATENATELIVVGRTTTSVVGVQLGTMLSELAAARHWQYVSHSMLPMTYDSSYEFMAMFNPEPPIVINENRSALSRFQLVL
jgi:hypothetical protein